MKEYNFDVEGVTNHLILWIRNWFEKNGKGCKAVLGMSGGKDSTVAAALLARALGSNNVVGVMMPDLGQGLNEADEICKFLGINCIYAPIDNITGAFYDSDITKDNGVWSLSNFSKQAEQNIPPRVRMTMLYAISQTLNGRVINTCNLSENTIGYETIFGDAAGDMSPLGNLTVSEVLTIGDYLEIPRKWVHKTPDDGLPNSMPDEEKFGFTYAELDDYIRTDNPETEDGHWAKIESMIYDSKFKREAMATFKPSDEELYIEIKLCSESNESEDDYEVF
jgi:NAD+ synthase